MRRTVLASLAIVGMVPLSASVGAESTATGLAALQAKDPARSVQTLYAECTSALNFEQGACAGYISAMSDHMWLLGGSAPTRAQGICVDVEVTYGADIQVFKNWAQKHPEKWSFDRMYGVILALQEIWPCK